MESLAELNDHELLALLREGDRAAYNAIYHKYKFVLYQHAWNKLRNREEAQDILQEVFASLWLKRETAKIGDNLSGYLYGSVRNKVLDHYARQEVKLRYVNNVKPDLEQGVATDHRVRENQLRALIDKEIAELSPRMREVFEMSRKQHMTYREIAEQLGTSEETVKKQVSGALKVLRVKLGILVYLVMLINY